MFQSSSIFFENKTAAADKLHLRGSVYRAGNSGEQLEATEDQDIDLRGPERQQSRSEWVLMKTQKTTLIPFFYPLLVVCSTRQKPGELFFFRRTPLLR